MRAHKRLNLLSTLGVISLLVGISQDFGCRLNAAVLMEVTTHGDDWTVPDGHTAGWYFTVGSEPLSVSKLGFWDKSGDGLTSAHAVGIWDADQSLLGSVTVQSGTASAISGGFRYESLGTPVGLSANTTYYLGALSTETDLFQEGGVYSYHASIGFGGSSHTSTAVGSLAFPDNVTFVDGYFGPNADFSVVPEPSTWLAAGFLGLIVVGRYGRSMLARFTAGR